MTKWFDRVVMTVLTLAAVAIAVVLVRRELLSPAQSASPAATPPEYRSDWREALNASVLIGDSNAPVVIVEFMDLECPFCRKFSAITEALRQTHGEKVALAFVHYPLDGLHRFARPAAHAVECAVQHDRFPQLVRGIYEKQDSLGLKQWTSYARDADIRDTSQFKRCVAAGGGEARIAAGLSLVQKLKVTGTPSVMINGWLLRTPPTEVQLQSYVAAFLAGRTPFSL